MVYNCNFYYIYRYIFKASIYILIVHFSISYLIMLIMCFTVISYISSPSKNRTWYFYGTNDTWALVIINLMQLITTLIRQIVVIFTYEFWRRACVWNEACMSHIILFGVSTKVFVHKLLERLYSNKIQGCRLTLTEPID